eukprot:TRINITY_DN2097_c0_g1_i5.p1 TRINITY_DN2097_c0_g1~~TRINITY_DN2097_c0_g1_i5.p1  ORF type:complete len:584 (-),score=108.88 TRINITY_DN2097_c0_g1_i5:270-2021(-)
MKLKRLGRGALSSALAAMVKGTGGRKDLKFEQAPKAATNTMHQVPLKERAGYPLKFPKGSVDPKNWRTGSRCGSERGNKPVIVDFSRAAWLPDDWGQGVKATSPIQRADIKPGSGGTFTVYMSPDGKTFYHKPAAEKYAGYKFTEEGGRNGQIRKAQLQGVQAMQVVRAQIKELEFTRGQNVGVDPDEVLFKLLTPKEKKCLPSKNTFHFCIVSARRATSLSGIQDIFMVQTQFTEAGVTPTWYVDEASVKDYRRLGLHAVVGGKLTAARNKALKDAAKMGKACVQASDDISAWEYRHGKQAKERTDDAMNKAHDAAKRYILSPVAAARFILAKMRGADGDKKPQLGGLYPLGSSSRTFAGPEFVKHNFIIGDFFVVDKSKVLFDEEMTLKEDYDFTCAHIKAHGSVLRCQRMTLAVKHYSNVGGAVDERDKKGVKERMNIAILNRKWPGCFRANPKRQNEVIMKWKGSTDQDEDDNDDDQDAENRGSRKKTSMKKTSRVKQTIMKSFVKNSSGSRIPPDISPKATLALTDTTPSLPKHRVRCKRLAGRTVEQALGTPIQGKPYGMADLRYDLKKGNLKLKKR